MSDATEYPNSKVSALLYGRGAIDATWTNEDFAALAIASCDQAGMSARDQKGVELLLRVLPRRSAK